MGIGPRSFYSDGVGSGVAKPGGSSPVAISKTNSSSVGSESVSYGVAGVDTEVRMEGAFQERSVFTLSIRMHADGDSWVPRAHAFNCTISQTCMERRKKTWERRCKYTACFLGRRIHNMLD